uniref:YaiI/YqxD family protein n=1 Tax=Pararhizobium sp. IMCC3301 TaxID=3067904 RepID=UPI00274280C5|nr:YaiI/YqxD family protein [Pararhizobium sp. IMCC3301]
MTIEIFIDADACPVKDEIYKVAFRYKVPVCVVSNSFIRIPDDPLISRSIVSAGPDAADDFIAERVRTDSVVVTADILLAERCLNSGATVIGPNGKPFTADSIGSAVATRALMEGLRSTGDITGGPPPFSRADRSRFLSALDLALVRLKRSA